MRLTLLALLLSLAALRCASADPALELGPRDDAITRPSTEECSAGTLYVNHDGTVENGYAWCMGWAPPYYGAFAEGFDLGCGSIVCGEYVFTQIGYFAGHPMDAYIWDGGVTREPGGVLYVVHDVIPESVPVWPECGENDIEISYAVSGEFSLGWWADFQEEVQQWFMCADENGPGGHPWTCIMPGIGYPTGWNNPSVVFGQCQSLVIGAHFQEAGSPAEAPTWGALKNLFAR